MRGHRGARNRALFVWRLGARRRAFSGAQLVAARGWAYVAYRCGSSTNSSQSMPKMPARFAFLLGLLGIPSALQPLARGLRNNLFHSYEASYKHVNRRETAAFEPPVTTSFDTQRRALLWAHTHRLDDARRREASQRCIRINSSREVSRRCRQMARWRPESLSSPWLNVRARAKR